MKKSDFIKLHLNLMVSIPKTTDFNPLPSDTDPTQDIPVKAIQMTASGVPINVKEYKGVFSNVKVENFTSIERRNSDAFDAVGELQQLSGNVKKSGVTTNYINPKNKTENEK